MERGGIVKVSQMGLDEGQQVQGTKDVDGEEEVWENMELVNLIVVGVCGKDKGG